MEGHTKQEIVIEALLSLIEEGAAVQKHFYIPSGKGRPIDKVIYHVKPERNVKKPTLSAPTQRQEMEDATDSVPTGAPTL